MAGATELCAGEPECCYGFVSLMSYAPHEFLVRRRVPVLFHPLVHPEHPTKQCLGPLLQTEQLSVGCAQEHTPLAHLPWHLALFVQNGLGYFAARLGDGSMAVSFFSAHQGTLLSLSGLATSPVNGARP